jgi:UDP:flavonoid glycosyltransferase YjiC (YdhE family)
MNAHRQRRRVLFVAEDITLAQVVRLNVLARSLDPALYEVHFACAHFDELVFAGATFARHPIFTLDRKKVFGKLERGGRLYDAGVLSRYVDEELALFSAVRPDVVIGDLRLSLCASAEAAGIPYASLINAYWSRHMVREAFPLPDHPIVRLLGERLAAQYFPRALPRVFQHFAAPVNKVRRKHRLAPMGDLIDVLLSGDRVLFPDVPYLTELRDAPEHHVFLGAVQWSPELAPPAFWDDPRLDRDSVYVTLGSSGKVDRLPTALKGLASVGLTSMVATAGRCALPELSAQLFAADYLPGSEAARRARFVLCNGGSSTAYQALAEGKPVLGIASNLDQYLAMSAIADRGAGILLRGSTVTPELVARAARRLLDEPSFTLAAQRAQRELRAFDCTRRFADVLASLWPQHERELRVS